LLKYLFIKNTLFIFVIYLLKNVRTQQMKRQIASISNLPVISNVIGGTVCTSDFTGRNSIADTGSGFKDIID